MPTVEATDAATDAVTLQPTATASDIDVVEDGATSEPSSEATPVSTPEETSASSSADQPTEPSKRLSSTITMIMSFATNHKVTDFIMYRISKNPYGIVP